MAIHNMRKKGTKVMGNNGIELERDGFIAVAGCVVSLVIQGIVRLDGRSIYLYLPTWRNARSNYVLLGCRKEVCC